MKKIFLLSVLGFIASFSSAQTGTETIDYTTTTGDKGSFTVNQVRGSTGGTVTNVSVTTGNGFTGTVANPTTNAAITLGTNVTGLLKGNGAAMSAASQGVDYSQGTSALGTGILKSTTSTGSLTIAIAADFPTLNQSTTGNAATVTTNANLTGPVTSVGNATTIGAAVVTNANLVNSSFATTLTATGTDVTVGSPTSLGGTLTINVPDASSTARGVISTGAQTLAGAKTFSGNISATGGLSAKSITVTATGTEAITQTYIKCNPAASDITRTLPASPSDGLTITYKRINSTAGNTIILPNSGQTIDTGSQVKLVSQHRAVTFQYELATTTWQVID